MLTIYLWPLFNVVLGDFSFRDTVSARRAHKNKNNVRSVGGTSINWYYEWSWFTTADSFPTREENTLALIINSLPGQFQDIVPAP